MTASTGVRSSVADNMSCLQEVEHLHCHRPENSSAMVCSGPDGDQRAELLFCWLVALTAVIVSLAVVLNLAVVLTVMLNRKLHTVINALVMVLGVNNVASTGLPVVLAVQARVQHPALCSLRAAIFIVTRGVSFTTIVTVTLLRYLMVVRNRSYPASSRNVLLFASVAVLPALVKWAIRRNHEIASCMPIVARTPSGFIIIVKFKVAFDLLTSIIAIIEYGSGLSVLIFCYIRILAKTLQSRRRVQAGQSTRTRWADSAPQNISINRLNAREDDISSKWTRRTVREKTTSVQRRIEMDERERQITSACGEVSTTASRSDHALEVEDVTSSQPASHRRIVVESQVKKSVSFAEKDRLVTRKTLTVAPFQDDVSQTSSEKPSTSSAAAESQNTLQTPSSAEVVLRPSRLVSVGHMPGSTSRRPSLVSRTRRRSLRHPHRPAGRADIVTMLSMSVLIALLFVVTFPHVLSIGITNRRAECVITAEERLVIFIVNLCSVGLGAVVSPLVLVLFSVDFRQAFLGMCTQAVGRAPRRGC